jgi:SAM-dependent methyltransferase
MLAELRAAVPGTPSVRAGAESLPLADARLDAVVVAQAWHWMDHGRVAAEFARVVRPGGVAALVWNVRDTTDALAEGLTALTSAVDLADAGEERVLTLPGGAFGDGELRVIDNPHDYSVDELVELVSTWSYVAMGPDPAGVLHSVRRLAEEHADASGRVRYRLRTRCHRFVRR